MSRIKNWFGTYVEVQNAKKARDMERLGHVMAKVTIKGKGDKKVEKYFLGKLEDLKKQAKKFVEYKVY